MLIPPALLTENLNNKIIMKILIKVTKEVLVKSSMCGCLPGLEAKAKHCGIAYAVRELFPNASVNYTAAYLLGFDHDACNSASLPEEAMDFIWRFDSSDPAERIAMKPFSFEIEVPEFVIQTIGINTVYKVLSESKTLEHVNPL